MTRHAIVKLENCSYGVGAVDVTFLSLIIMDTLISQCLPGHGLLTILRKPINFHAMETGTKLKTTGLCPLPAFVASLWSMS